MFRDEEPITHAQLTDFMNRIGIKTEPGVCHGLAGVGISELLLDDDEHIYNHRLNCMGFFWRHSNGQPTALMERMLPTLGAEDKNLTQEIPTFLRAVDINACPSEYPEKFPTNAKLKQKLSQTIPVASHSKITDFAYSDVITGVYTLENLYTYFNILKSMSTQLNIAMAVSSIDHTFFIKYSGRDNCWKYGNTDKMVIRRLNTEGLVNEIYHYYDQQITIFSLQLFALNNETIKQALYRLESNEQWKTLHCIIKEKIQLSDNNGTRWVHIAAQNGDLKTLRKILSISPDLLEAKCNNGVALKIAEDESQDETVQFICEIAQRQRP